MLATKTGQELSNLPVEQMNATAVAQQAADELVFGSNNKASADYRRAMFAVLAKQALEEVLACK